MLNQQNILFLDEKMMKHKEQSKWHRDIPYQRWIPKGVMAFNTLLCLSSNPVMNHHVLDILEKSHLEFDFPNDKPNHRKPAAIHLRHGDTLFMNSFLYHRAPIAIKNNFFLVNMVFTPRCMKQQVNIRENLNSNFFPLIDNNNTSRYLGLDDRNKQPTFFSDT